MVREKGNPRYCLGFYRHQRDPSYAAHSACARPVGSQSCCQNMRSEIVLCSPDTSPWGDMPALWGLSWICFPTLPSPPYPPTPGAAQLWQRCSRRETQNFLWAAKKVWVSPAYSSVPRRAETTITSPTWLAGQGEFLPPPASSEQIPGSTHVCKNHTETTLLPWGDKEDTNSLWQMLARLLKALLNGTCKTGDCHSTKPTQKRRISYFTRKRKQPPCKQASKQTK